jgi:hypothetical protein
MGTALALAFLLFESKPIYISMIALNASVMALTGSRAALISTAIVVQLAVIFYLMTKKTSARKAILPILYLSILAIGLVLFLPNILTLQLVDRLQLSLTFWNDPTGSLSTRLGLFQFGFDILESKPFGIGYAHFVTMTDNLILWEQNLFLNTALGAGILGLLGLVGFFIIFFLRGFSRLFSKDGEVDFFYFLSLAPSLVFFINSLGSDPNAETSVYISWLILGIAFASISLQTHTSLTRIRQ